MSKHPRTFLVLAVLALVAAAAGAAETPTLDARSGFDLLKSLDGEWQGKAGMGDFESDATVTYHVTAGGSAVVETLFPGTEHEMKTVYHMDGERLVLVHYCHQGNQPRMVFEPGEESDVLVFEPAGGSNVDAEHGTYMHDAVIRVRPDGTLESRWQSYDGGAPGPVARFVLARQK